MVRVSEKLAYVGGTRAMDVRATGVAAARLCLAWGRVPWVSPTAKLFYRCAVGVCAPWLVRKA